MKKDRRFRIFGQVIEKESRDPLRGLTVKAVDRDLLFDDLLGTAVTDNRGRFEIRYDSEEFRELIFDEWPDIYLKIIDPDGELIHSTLHQVRIEADLVEKFLVQVPRSSVYARSAVEFAIERAKGGEFLHPDGLSFRVEPGSFESDNVIRVANVGEPEGVSETLANLGRRFWLQSSVESLAPIQLAVTIDPGELEASLQNCVFFLELEQSGTRSINAGDFVERAGDGKSECVVVGPALLPRNVDVAAAVGVFTPLKPSSAAFHPTPHQFKVRPLDREDDEPGTCRREGTTLVDGVCRYPVPQTLYPACFPAAYARLYGAYEMVLTQPHRRWEIGTPQCPEPPPDEHGDFFSTWSMVTDAIGQVPPAVDIADWQTADLAHLSLHPYRFELRPGEVFGERSVEDDIRSRADRIKGALISLVGRHGSSAGRPVLIEHSGHAWNVFGVDVGGFWSHGQNPDTASLSDWCSWENADWLQGELALLANPAPEVRPHPEYKIRYPSRSKLKPRRMRLGSMSFSGSGGKSNYVRFTDLASGRSVDWTPHMKASSAGVGYIWIESGSPLDNAGVPIDRPELSWSNELGLRAPLPRNRRSDCRCRGDDGCHRCRTRLQLPFWVHNTSKDETLSYRIDLYFWTSECRWVALDAQVIRPPEGERFPVFAGWYPGRYGIPDSIPTPGEVFEIKATPDTDPKRSVTVEADHPLNWQPIAWYVDFERDQLLGTDSFWPALHGIKLVLTCLDAEPGAQCTVQDIKQIWFESEPELLI